MDPTTLGVGVITLHFEITGALNNTGSDQYLVTARTSNVEVYVRNIGELRVRVNSVHYSGIANLTFGVQVSIPVVADYTTALLTVSVDGVTVRTQALGTPPASFASTQRITLLGKASSITSGTWVALKVWKNSPTGASAPYKLIQGNAATVNADPWKTGANAF